MTVSNEEEMINIEINGIPLEVREGSMIIEVADDAGITIPRFCYHKKLSVAANCRMCLVEVEKAPKPLPACATPVMEGMKVFTKSKKAIEAQKSVMEFLLINHPLDCPICDQGGECELQDIAMGFGNSASRYTEQKRVVGDKNIGPLISTEMTRCIHCTRCVRFGQEIAGIMELGAAGRGEHTRIGTYIARTVDSEMSGNVIDLCPVGALTSKPYRYHGRPWENTHHDSIAPHDCIGSNISVETRRNEVMRVLPKENEAINEMWLSDRDRFSYCGLTSNDRLTQPMLKQGDEWVTTDWQTALNYAVEGLKTVIDKSGADKIGALVSPSATLEEMYLLQKLLRGLGSNNIDHRLRQLDFSDQVNAPTYPTLGINVAELETIDSALLIGSCIRKDQPIAAHRLRKASRKGASIMAVNTLAYDFNFRVSASIVSAPQNFVADLSGIVKALLETGANASELKGLPELVKNTPVTETQKLIAENLLKAQNGIVILGTQAHMQEQFAATRALAHAIAKLANVSVGYLPDGANSVGAWQVGAVPHRVLGGEPCSTIGKNTHEMLTTDMKAFVLLGIEPELDTALAAQSLQAMNDADFVVSLSGFMTDSMRAYADVVLPMAIFTETSGTYVNIEAKPQSFQASVTPGSDIRPAWKVLRVLGNLFAQAGFEYVTIDDVRREIESKLSGMTRADYQWQCPATLAASRDLSRIGYLPIYAIDALVRRSAPLQKTGDALTSGIYINSQTAKAQNLAEGQTASVSQNGYKVTLLVFVNDAIPVDSAFIPSATNDVIGLGASFGHIELSAN